MKWNKWPYWLRGGAHLSFAFVVIFLLVYLLGLVKISTYTVQCLIPPCWDVLHVYVGSVGPFVRNPEQLALIALMVLVSAFIAGAIIGFLYGKIKNRKSSTLNPTS